MRPLGVIAALAAFAALATVASAASLPPGSTVLVSRPGFDPLPAGAVNRSSVQGHGAVSEDGRYVVFSSQADGLLGQSSRYFQVFRLDRTTGTVTLVSARPDGSPGSGDSAGATVSADGTRVSYGSRAEDLVAGTHDGLDVFYRDLAAPGTQSTLVSRASNTPMSLGDPGNSQSVAGQISADGTTVAFTSASTNLHPADVSGENSVYVRTLDTTPVQTELVSRADGAGGASAEPAGANSISATGNVVAFTTSATGLDPFATDTNGAFDVYARSRAVAQTRLISRRTDGTVGLGNSINGVLSANGSVAALQSAVPDLVSGDGNNASDVFRRTPTFGPGTTTLVSRTPAATVTAGNGASSNPAISSDGGVVVFTSDATNLLAGPDSNGLTDVFARTVATDTTVLLSRDEVGAPAAGSSAEAVSASISRDGTLGVFESGADTLSALDDDDYPGVYSAAVAGGPATHLSRPAGLSGPFEGGVADAFVGLHGVSTDGRYVAFLSESDSLSADDDDRFGNAFVRDVLAGTTTLVSRASGAAGAAANDDTTSVSVSADGRRAIFTTGATNLDPDDHDSTSDVYVRDLGTGVTTLVSRADGAAGAKANAGAFAGLLDADGSRASFVTGATNLGSGSDAAADVFVRDLDTGATLLASRDDGPDGADANASSGGGSLSADGTRVAFSSNSTNLVDDTDATGDIFVRDLATGRTFLASRADGGDGVKGNAFSTAPALSGDGSRVAFATASTNLGDGDTTSPLSVYVRDLTASNTRLVSRADGPTGLSAPAPALNPDISDDGNRIVFGTSAGNLTGEAPAGSVQYFVRDLGAARTLLVSRADGLAGPPMAPITQGSTTALSGNGRCAAFLGAPDSGFSNPQFASLDFFQVYLRAIDGECAPGLPAAGVAAVLAAAPRPPPRRRCCPPCACSGACLRWRALRRPCAPPAGGPHRGAPRSCSGFPSRPPYA
jgi:Tol biopolymer transport system component